MAGHEMYDAIDFDAVKASLGLALVASEPYHRYQPLADAERALTWHFAYDLLDDLADGIDHGGHFARQLSSELEGHPDRPAEELLAALLARDATKLAADKVDVAAWPQDMGYHLENLDRDLTPVGPDNGVDRILDTIGGHAGPRPPIPRRPEARVGVASEGRYNPSEPALFVDTPIGTLRAEFFGDGEYRGFDVDLLEPDGSLVQLAVVESYPKEQGYGVHTYAYDGIDESPREVPCDLGAGCVCRYEPHNAPTPSQAPSSKMAH